MIMSLTSTAVRAIAGIPRLADAVLVRQAAANAASSLATLAQRHAEADHTLRHLATGQGPSDRPRSRVA
jgi:hypothetical protein